MVIELLKFCSFVWRVVQCLFLQSQSKLFLGGNCHARDVAEKLIREARSSPVEPPWSSEPCWSQLLHDEDPGGLERFHRPDIWHSFHLGIGKSYIASSIWLLQHLTGESSVDRRVEVMSNDFREFCQQNKKVMYLRKLDASTFGLKGKEPHGSWNKAHITSTLMEWMESFINKHRDTCQADGILRYIATSLLLSRVLPRSCFNVFLTRICLRPFETIACMLAGYKAVSGHVRHLPQLQ